MTDKRIADNGKTIDHIADDGKKVLTDKEIYPPLKNITLEQAYEDYAKATEEMEDTLLEEIRKLREKLEHLQGEREVLLEDIKSSSNQVIEQQAEIEKLNVELVGMKGACNSYKMHYDNAKAEIEELNIRLRKERHQFEDVAKMHNVIRAEAIKEFVNILKKDTFRVDTGELVIEFNDIDNLVKEMVGEQE